MFVYQNADRDICVTFKNNRPVKDPEYVISIDHEKNVISVNGQEMVPVVAEDPQPEETAVVDTPVEPEKEEEPEQTETDVVENTGADDGLDETEE